MQNSGVVTLLHLSDLHFGRHHRFASDDGPNSLLERLWMDLDGLCEKDGLTPDLVVVSGDLAEFGKKAEFEQAIQFLQKLVQAIGLPTSRVIIVPGNHDINWNLCKSYFEDCAANDELPVRPYFKKLEWFRTAFDKFYGGAEGITFRNDEPWSFFEYPELGVVVAGLNSVIAESHEHHWGFLGEEQLRAFAAKLRPYKEREFLRVGVMHHNPRDRRGGEDTKKDQDQIRRLLAPALNLLLHGDGHEETEEALLVNVPVLGIGSLGVALARRPEEVPNEYQLLQVRAEGIRRFLRVYTPDQRRFLPSARANGNGAETVVDIAVAFEHARALGQTQPAKRETDLEELVEQYRAAIVKDQRMRTVGDWLGRDALGMPMTALDVLRLFVPQDVMREEPVRYSKRERMRAIRDETRGEFTRDLPDEPFVEREEWERFAFGSYSSAVEEALARGWVYLLGAPGAGKTALTRWILLSLCVPGESLEGFSGDLVPVRIDMRLFHAAYEKTGGALSIFDYLDRAHAERFLTLRGDPMRELARRGRLYFLFDGLDEVIDESKRHAFAEMIYGLATSGEYGRCRGVVTSRVVGAEVAQALFDGSGFSTYTLRDFTEQQQDRFLNAWHDLVFAHEPEMLAHRRTRLARALEASQSLRALCGNPLCCSLLAYLNRDEELPEGRHHLYQKILERLAEHWDANKDLPVRSGTLRFELSDKLSFCRRLAGHMMETGGSEAGNAIATEQLVRFAQGFCQEQWSETAEAAKRRAEALIGNLRERNEVLVWLGGDLYGFSHRAFLEYSAAARAIEQHGRRAGISELALWFRRHWREEGWEETLLLTCGLLREVDQGPALVVQLLQEMPGEDRAAVYRDLDDYLCFCIKALGELRSLEHGVVRGFVDQINGVLEYQIQCDPPIIPAHRLLGPFRRCAGKWPDVERLMHTTAKRNEQLTYTFDELFPVWIAAAGRSGRLDILLRAIEVYQAQDKASRIIPWTLSKEASRLGPWPYEELTGLCEVAETLGDDNDRYNILADVMLSPGMALSEDNRGIRNIFAMMTTSGDTDIQQKSAWLLAHLRLHEPAALTKLREFLATSSTALYRKRAARILCLLGHTAGALDTLLGAARDELTYLETLIESAKGNQDATDALRNLLPHIRQHPDMRVFVQAYRLGVEKNWNIIPTVAVSQRLDALDENLHEVCLGWLLSSPRLTPFLAEQYQKFLPQIKGAAIFHSGVSDALRLEPKYAGLPVKRLWEMLLNSSDTSTVIRTARRIFERRVYPELIAVAQAKMLQLLNNAARSESIELAAARTLIEEHPQARNVCARLAKNGLTLWTRYDAARTIGDFASIAELAHRANDGHVKTSAREAQDLYTHIHNLLNVGRPRKAIVKLHNERAGALIETSFQGGTQFIYDKSYREKPSARPLAPNLPLRAEPYEHPTTLLPFFANLLPEGTILEQTARRLGLPKTDRFGILLNVGEDVMGAVQVLPEEAN